MSGSTNIIGLSINSSNPLSTLHGGIGRSVTPTSGSVLFYDSTGVQQNNANLFWNNSSIGLSIGTTTFNAPLTVQTAGGTSYSTAIAAYFGSVVGGTAGNLYLITIAKGSFEAALLGINKNTTTGNFPSNCVFISSYSSTGSVAIGQGNNSGLPNTAALIVTNQVNIPYLTGSNLVVTDGASNLISTNTLSSTVLGNITKVTVTKFTSGSGTYNSPANCTHIRLRMWGGGGGGGGVAGNASSGGAAGGGGSGSYIETIITNPTSYAYSVGAAGSGGAAGNNTGGTGGSSTFGSFTAGGATGGSGYNAGLSAGTALGGQGSGNGGSPTLSCIGNPGFPGITLSSTVAVSGMGAPSPFGGGAGVPGNTSGGGGGGSAPGGGGAGSVSLNGISTAGNPGGFGLIIIEEYYNG
jgi:hypothetical protein